MSETATSALPHPFSYRDDEAALCARRAELVSRHRAALDELPAEVRLVHARRLARSVAGAVALAGGILLAIAAGVDGVARLAAPDSGRHPGLTVALLAAVGATLVAYVAGRALASRTLRRRLAAALAATDDVRRDVARLEADPPGRLVARLVDADEYASVLRPLLGVTVLAPISLHFVVWILFIRRPSAAAGDFADFDLWILYTLVLVGMAHVTLGLASRAFAKRLRAFTPDGAAKNPGSGWDALLYACLGALVPGGFLYLIPPMIVFGTGVLFVPATFTFVRVRVLDERRRLAAALPTVDPA